MRSGKYCKQEKAAQLESSLQHESLLKDMIEGVLKESLVEEGKGYQCWITAKKT